MPPNLLHEFVLDDLLPAVVLVGECHLNSLDGCLLCTLALLQQLRYSSILRNEDGADLLDDSVGVGDVVLLHEGVNAHDC